ncbi:MAG: hypothetical protein ACR2HH_12400, partial [Chthoniobacterales bacterium]
LFFDNPESPVQCAVEISRALKDYPRIQLRMGAHSGAIKEVKDVNERSNFAGAGINIAQRVLDCGDAGHILLSQRIAEDLAAYQHWHPHLHDLGECAVKHGLRLHLFNLCKEGSGNPAVPQKIAQQRRGFVRGRNFLYRHLAGSPRRKIISAAVLCVVLLALVTWVRLSGDRARPSIAVLPFENSSDEKGNQYFVDGMQDEIIGNLQRVADLKVISRTSVARYRADAVRDLREIGKVLDVSHVLVGIVQRIGNHIRVHATLIDVATKADVWTEFYDRNEANVFDIQSDIAQRIAGQLKFELSPSEKAAISKRPTRDLVAYDNYVRARGLINDSVFGESPKEKLLRAVSLLGECSARDSQFFLAYYQEAYAQDRLYHWFDPSRTRLAAAETAIDALVHLRPNAGETHLARARHFYWGLEDYSHARQELELAQTALPNDPDAPLLLGYLARREGRWEESSHSFARALELDPLNPIVLQQIALSDFSLRRFQDMTTILRRASRLSPEDVLLRSQLAAVELEWHAKTEPLHQTLADILKDQPTDGGKIVEPWLYLALCERDFASATHALDYMSETSCHAEGVPFPESWCTGVVARLRGRESDATQAFARSLQESEKFAAAQPNDGGAWCAVAMEHAALGETADAIRDGQRAVALVPIDRDAITAPLMVGYLAIIYSWSGETDQAIEQLRIATKVPSYWSYGNLRLHPYWDALRGDPRFAEIVNSLAPNEH